MRKQFNVGPFGPWLNCEHWHLSIGSSFYFNWRWQNAHERKTYRYVGLNVLCPFYIHNGKARLNSFRFGKHVDHCGRVYIYFAWLVFFQDVHQSKFRKEWETGSHRIFVWS